MSAKNPRSSCRKPSEEDLDAMIRRALREPGVAGAVELYERAEGIYQNLASTAGPQEYTKNSTNA